MAEATTEKLINGKYRLLSELGRGAMGVVYRAEQLDIESRPQRQVALKTLLPHLSTDPDFSRRFLREVRVAMQLRNLHTVTVYDSGKDEAGQLYYTMELIRGQTLREVLQRQGKLSVERTVRIASQICEALEEAHGLSEPVVHRDLKPPNIFVEQRQGQEWVKIGDFGIAKVLGEHTSRLTSMDMSPGTPRYMAPEQWTGQAVDGRTDLYALGIIIYEMLTGRPPFTAEGVPLALMSQHVHTPPPALPAAIPSHLRMLVGQLLAKTPHERPPDALSVRRALEATLNGEGTAPTELLGKEEQNNHLTKAPTSLPVRSSSRLPLAIAGVAVVLIAVVAFLLLNPGHQKSETLAPGGGTTQVKSLRTAPLALRLAIMKRGGNTVSVLKEGDALTSGDYYGVFFEPAQESFVYVLQQDTTGKIDVLFPDPKVMPQTNPIPSGKSVWVPQDENHWFYLDENTGREVIIVAASARREEKLEAMLRSVNDQRSQGALADWLVAPERGRGGVKQLEKKPVFSSAGKTLDLETALVQGSGADFVYKVAFQHKWRVGHALEACCHGCTGNALLQSRRMGAGGGFTGG